MKFRKRKRTEPGLVPTIIELQGPDGYSRIPLKLYFDGFPEIKHVIRHEPRPRPTVIQPIFYNQEGREFRTLPINCDGRYTVPVYFPLGWLNGDLSDAQQCSMRLELRYNDPF